LHFSSEEFCYLFHVLSVVRVSAAASQKQAFIMCYYSLTLEAKTEHITKTYLQTVTKQGLQTLNKVLGIRVGLRLPKKKPAKRALLAHCTEGSYMTPLELAFNVSAELVRKHML
jgi:hypothetical protein